MNKEITENEFIKALHIVKNFCKNHDANSDYCYSCRFQNNCGRTKIPENWNLPDIDAESIFEGEKPDEQVYYNGMYDCLELIKNIRRMKIEDYKDAFGENYDTFQAIIKLSPIEIKEKYDKWLESKTFRTGDIVVLCANENTIMIITKVYNDYGAYVLYEDGSSGEKPLNHLKKIGKSVDIAALLSQIKEEI